MEGGEGKNCFLSSSARFSPEQLFEAKAGRSTEVCRKEWREILQYHFFFARYTFNYMAISVQYMNGTLHSDKHLVHLIQILMYNLEGVGPKLILYRYLMQKGQLNLAP